MNRLTIILIAMLVAGLCNGQIFKPKRFSDLKFYPNDKNNVDEHKLWVWKEREILEIKEITLSNINDVFPGAKFIAVRFRFPGYLGTDEKTEYLMKYKGIYYEKDYLNFLEKETNNNKFSDASLEKRISAFATIAFYDKLKTEVNVDSISILHKNPDGESECEYMYYYNYKGFVQSNKTYLIYNAFDHLTLSEFSFGKMFALPDDNKSINFNILNTDPYELIGNKKHYYFNVASSTAQIEVTGLNPSLTTRIYFLDPVSSSSLFDELLTVSANGTSIYNYNSSLKTGVYKVKVINGSADKVFDGFFIPEDRLEVLTGAFKYRIYTTEMFYNSVANSSSLLSYYTGFDYTTYRELVKNTLMSSYNTYSSLGFINSINDQDGIIDLYLSDFASSGIPYHAITSISSPAFTQTNFANHFIYFDYGLANYISNKYLSEGYTYSVCPLHHLIKTGISHEFFHIVQKNLNTSIFNGGESMMWLFDGTARFMQTVFLEQSIYSSDLSTEFAPGSIYHFNSMQYLKTRLYTQTNSTSSIGQLENIKYDYCLYWRFMYEKYKPGASAIEKCAFIKNAIQNCPSSYNLSAIKTQMDAAFSSGGAFNNFQHSLTHFAKDVALIKYSIGQWMYNNTYPNPNIDPKTYIGQHFSEEVNTNAAFGITINKIPLYGHGSFTVTFNKNTILGNCSYSIYVYATNSGNTQVYLPSSPASPIVQFDGSNSISCTFNYLPSNCILYLAFVQTRLSDASSSVNYVIVNNDNNVNMIADFSPKYINIAPGATVVFQDASSYSSYYYCNWTFTGGDPETANTPTVSVRYDDEGIYPVKLVINQGQYSSTKNVSGCVNVSNQNIDAPMADFSYSVAGSTVTFNNLSTNSPTSWFWDFGDGFTSTQQNPFHTYANNTNVSYTVTMTASNASGYSSAVKTIEFSSQGTITITGRVTINNVATAGVLVKTIYSNGPEGPVTYTGANGNYTLVLNNNFSGTIVPVYDNCTCSPAVFTDLQYSISGLNFGMFPVQINITSEQLYGTYYCFTVNNAPIFTELYQWTITNNNSGTSVYVESLSRKLNHFFNMSSSDDVYTVGVNVIDNMGQAFYASLSITIFHTSIIDSYAYPANNCSAVRKGECYYLYDGSSPFSEVSRVVIWSSNGTTQIWDTDNPNSLQNSKDPDHSMYRANCRKFEQCFSAQGVYSGSITTYDLAGFPQDSYDYGITVVDCNLTSTNFNNSVGFTYNNIKHSYSGKQHISSMANLPGYQNYNTSIKACKEIILEGDMEIEPVTGSEFNIVIDPCLYEEETVKAVEQEEYSQAIPNEPAEEQKHILTGDYGVKIYPNPNEGKFAVETMNNDIQSIQIYNSVGQIMQSFDNLGNTLYLMDISNQPKGVYYLKVRSTKSVQTFKVINSVIL